MRIRVLGDATAHGLAFPAWKWVGGPAPTSIAANTTGWLTVTFLDATDATAIARWRVGATPAPPTSAVYETWAGAAGSLPDAGRWVWGTDGEAVLPALTGCGGVALTTPGSTTGGIIRSTMSFPGEVRGTIIAQPPGSVTPPASGGLRVIVAFAVQDTNPVNVAHHFPDNGYYVYIDPHYNSLAVYRRIDDGDDPPQ